MLQKNRHDRPAGNTETEREAKLPKALERNLSNVKHDRSLPLLDFILGEVLGYPSNSNKARIPRRWKCSRRVCPIQQ